MKDYHFMGYIMCRYYIRVIEYFRPSIFSPFLLILLCNLHFLFVCTIYLWSNTVHVCMLMLTDMSSTSYFQDTVTFNLSTAMPSLEHQLRPTFM